MAIKIKGNLKSINKTPIKKSFLIPAIENVLSKKIVGKDRNHGWNSPSGICNCSRLSYFMRKNFNPDKISNEPRLQRIFDNGTHVHIRLQEYLLNSGASSANKIPLFNKYSCNLICTCVPLSNILCKRGSLEILSGLKFLRIK